MVPVTKRLPCVHRFYCDSLLGWACCICDVSFPHFTVYVPLWINSTKVSTTRDKVSINKYKFPASSDNSNYNIYNCTQRWYLLCFYFSWVSQPMPIHCINHLDKMKSLTAEVCRWQKEGGTKSRGQAEQFGVLGMLASNLHCYLRHLSGLYTMEVTEWFTHKLGKCLL